MKTQCEKSKKSKFKTRTVKRGITNQALPVTYTFDVIWAFGASTVAAMASPLLIH